MSRDLSDTCWSSDDSSFGWVDMEDKESVGAKKANRVEHRPSGSEDDSNDDSTEFHPDSNSRPVLDTELKQKDKLSKNSPVSTPSSGRQVKNDVSDSEDSDSTQFDAQSDNRPVVEDKLRSKGNTPVTVKGNQLKSPGPNNASNHETSESSSGESSSDSSDDSTKKDLKPFTKRLLVKKERHSHALSDDSNVDSPPLKTRLSVRPKSESGTPQKKTKEDSRATLIDGVLLDTAQPLPFNIGANEDVWIVQCPNELSESTLKGKTLNFNGVSCTEQFESRVLVTGNQKPVNLLLPKSPLKLTSLTPTGHIIFKEKEMASHILHPVFIEDNMTSLPTGLKERHPLFGADLSLVQSLSSQLRKRKKMMKKKKQDVSDLGATFCEDGDEVREAKNITTLSNDLDDSPMHKKKKKKKIKHLDEQVIAFSKDLDIKNPNFQLPSFHSGSSPKIASEKDINRLVVSNCMESELQQKRKKVKHEPGEAVSPEITNAHPELAYVTPSKKRKHKHLEHSFESDRQVAGGFSDDVENIISQKRKKRKYENESNTSHDVYSTSERTIEPNQSLAESSHPISSKKKKHHKYEIDFQSKNVESVNNRADESAVCSQDMILDPVTNEMLHTIKKKKKKIKEKDMDFMVTSNIPDVNNVSTKKKKKLKMENSDEHLGQLSFDARDTKVSICDVAGADLDYFDANRRKNFKKERWKLEETTKFSEENLPHKKLQHSLDSSLLTQESSYGEYSPVTDMHHKKKKKRKSE